MTDPFSLTHRNGTAPYPWRNTLPGFVSARETVFVNESLGDSHPMARHRQIRREINGLAAGAHRGADGNRVSH